jgi:hypothetical protein
MKADIDVLTRRFNLSPYQIYMLSRNWHKYDTGRIRKFGDMVYAPYLCTLTRGFRDAVAKLLFGPRADLIGSDRMIISDRRGINIRKITGG